MKCRLIAAVMAGVLVAGTQVVQAAPFSFATFNWDDSNTPNVYSHLGGGATLGGALFSAGNPTTAAGDVGFPDQAAGSHNLSTFNTALTIARLSGIAITANTSRPLNLPSGNNGTATRHGSQLSWTGGVGLPNNGVGNDFVVYESASSISEPEGLMVRVRLGGTTTFTSWYYVAPTNAQLYVSDATNGATATPFDLTNMGLASNAIIDQIQIANLTAADRINGTITHSFGPANFGQGVVVFDGSTTVLPDPGSLAPSANPGDLRNTGYGTATLDPDPIYVGILNTVQVVPEPVGMSLVLGSALMLVQRRRRH